MSSNNETNIALYQQMVQNVQQTAGKIKLQSGYQEILNCSV